jgi:integrase
MPKASKTGIRGYYVDANGDRRIDLRYRDANGAPQRHQEEFKPGTPARAAEQRAREVLAAATLGTLVKRGTESPETLATALKKYLEWCAVNGRGDPKYKERHRDHLLVTFGAGFPLADLSELAIEKHKKRRTDAGKEPGTVNRELVTVKHFLNRCVDWGWLEKRPKVVLLQEPPPRVRWLSDKERAALGAALATPQRVAFRRVVFAALLSGQRLGKIITLQKADVDLAGKTLTIADMAKGGKRKTTHVPIGPALASVLKEAMAESGDGEHVFTTGRRKKRPYTRSGVSTFFARVVEEAKIENFHFHDLRHTFATEVRRGGAGLDVVQALLGHASPAMTQRYAHLGRPEFHAAVAGARALPSPMPGKVKKPRAKSVKTSAKSTSRRAS